MSLKTEEMLSECRLSCAYIYAWHGSLPYRNRFRRWEKKKEDLSQIVTGIRGIERFSVVTSQLGCHGCGFRGGVLQLWYQSRDRIPAGIYRMCTALHHIALTWTCCTEDWGTSRALHSIKVTSALHELIFHFWVVFETKLKRIKRVLTAEMYRDGKRGNC